jgi:hypothetical protein
MVRLPWLAIGAALWASGARAEESPRPLCWRDGLSSEEQGRSEGPGSSPGPCVPLAVALDEARRKAHDAEARDRNDITAMMNVVGRALALRGTPGDQARQGKAPVWAGRADDVTGELAKLESATAQPAGEYEAEVPHPPRRPIAELTRLENARKAALAAALKRKQLAEARKQALASRQRLSVPAPAAPSPAMRAWPQPASTSGSLP